MSCCFHAGVLGTVKADRLIRLLKMNTLVVGSTGPKGE